MASFSSGEEVRSCMTGPYSRADVTRDWAFFRAPKLSDSQVTYLRAMAENDGRTSGGGSVGIEFGGWVAHQKIVAALKRMGLVKAEGRELVLVEGEPVVYVPPVLPKPYIKVRRQLLDLWDGERIATQDVWVWLDPRGDATFHVVLLPEVATHNEKRKESEKRGGMVEGGHFASRGKSFEEATARAVALCREHMALEAGVQEEVLLVSYEVNENQKPGGYDKTGLSLRYDRLLLINGQLYDMLPNGGIEAHRGHTFAPGGLGSVEQRAHFSKRSQALISYTPERLAALETLRLQLAGAAAKLRSILAAEDFEQLIDSHGHHLLAHSGEVAHG